MQNKKRILVDMSATLIHHGHIRLLKKAAEYGSVIVSLSTDEDILEIKGYEPELNFEERKEILLAIRYVDEVIAGDYYLSDEFLDKHNIDLLVHGDDNMNNVKKERLLIFPRTEGVSSSELRKRVIKSVESINSRK